MEKEKNLKLDILIEATELGCVEIVDKILKEGVDPYEVAQEGEYKGMNAVRTAAAKGRENILDLFIERGYYSEKLIDHVIEYHRDELFEKYYPQGLKEASRDIDYYTHVLHKIAAHGSTDMMRFVLADLEKNVEKEKRLKIISQPIFYWFADPDRIPEFRTAFDWAIESGKLEKVKLLLDAGAQISELHTYDVIQKAFFSNSPETLKIVLDKIQKKNLDRYTFGFIDRRPIPSKEILTALLDHKKVAHLEIDCLRAALYSSKDILQLALEHPRVDRSKNILNRVLREAASNNCGSKIDLLVSHGADINDTGYKGYTPLMLAAEERNIIAVRHLLNYNPDATKRNIYGRTAAQLAIDGFGWLSGTRRHIYSMIHALEKTQQGQKNEQKIAQQNRLIDYQKQLAAERYRQQQRGDCC